MVNLEKRQIAKRLIERFLACEITNDGFDDAFPRDQGDPALDAIYSNLWAYYSENNTHKLAGKYALRADARELFQRCAAFLGTALEYEWPRYQWISPKYALLRMFGFSKKINNDFERFKSSGNFQVRPFAREGDYRRALATG
jgi:hypothetical protein